ncbi:MAG: DUF6597 domain-containing transcriptional factor [Vicinamibacteria bacterium]
MLHYVEHPPPLELEPFVECVWSVFDRRRLPRREPDRVVPDGCPELIVHLADSFARRRGGRFVRQPRAFLAGTLTRPWLLRAGPRVLTLGIRFRPAGAAALLRASLEGTADREVPLAALVESRAARELLRGLRRARTPARRFAAALAWLQARLAEGPAASGARAAVDLILRSRGAIRIEDVARRLGQGRRRLERAFARELGIRPKLYARIVRLNAVLATLDERERAPAVDLALEAGYFDQAHLLRDFRALAQKTPRSGREADGPLARHFTHPERLRAVFIELGDAAPRPPGPPLAPPR